MAAMPASTPTRRIGAEGSSTRAQLVDAAEAVLLEEGYAAVTSRRVAAKAGLKPQLVHYYFRTMDDLYVEVFRRRAETSLQRIEALVDGDVSLRTLWDLNVDLRGATFSIEFVALANHRKSIRAEIAKYAERFRAAQLEAMRAALERAGVPESRMPAEAALLLTTGFAQVMALEAGLGVTTGHDSTSAYIVRMIEAMEGEPGRDDQPGTSPRGIGSGRSV
jgi:AcrR family transcriptional regulator